MKSSFKTALSVDECSFISQVLTKMITVHSRVCSKQSTFGDDYLIRVIRLNIRIKNCLTRGKVQRKYC